MLKSKIYSLPMNLHKHQLYLLEQHSESFKIWSAIIRINTEGKSLIMKLGPGLLVQFLPRLQSVQIMIYVMLFWL